MATMIKKMSAKTILGKNVKTLIPEGEDGAVEYLFTIFGTAREVRSGTGPYGDWASLVGEFEAVSPDGETFQSAQCFLPEPMHSMMVCKLREINSNAIDFAVKVLIKKRPDLGVGYEYLGEMIRDAQAADPLAHMRAMVMENLKSLPAPEPAPKKGK